MEKPLRSIPGSRVRETVVTPFNLLSVVQVGARVDLDVKGATYATWHPTQIMTGYSWDALVLGCLLRHGGPPRSVLVLGLGGGTVARQLRCFLPEVRIVGVEIDEGVVDLARRYLHLDASVEVHVKDAYDFLAEGGERFDAVIDDLFLSGSTDVVRSRVPDGDTLKLVRSRVAEGGVVVANLITDVGDHAVVRAAARRGFGAGFKQIRVATPPRGLNEVLVGGDHVQGAEAVSAWAPRLDDEQDRIWLRSIKVAGLQTT